MNKTYIQKINESKAQDLIDFLEDYFKNIYAFYCEQNENQSSIIIKDMQFCFVGEYLITDTDCVELEPTYPVEKSTRVILPDFRVKKAIVKFMKSAFPDYETIQNYDETVSI